jgi:putative transposase
MGHLVTQDTKPGQSDRAAGQRLAKALSAESIDALIKDAKSAGTPLDGVDGLLNQMTKAVLERALQAELTDHLGYDAGVGAHVIPRGCAHVIPQVVGPRV